MFEVQKTQPDQQPGQKLAIVLASKLLTRGPQLFVAELTEPWISLPWGVNLSLSDPY